MNRIKYFLIMLFMVITLASCSTTYASVQSPYEYDDTYTTASVTFSTVVRYGTPYYIDNVLSYYLYRGIYYYPYRYNDYWYFYPSPYCRPRGYVYHYQPGYRHYMEHGPRGYEFKGPLMRPNRNPKYGRPHDNRPPFNYGTPPSKPSFGNQRRPPMNNRPNFNNNRRPDRRPNGVGSNRSSTRVTQGNIPFNNRSSEHFGGRR